MTHDAAHRLGLADLGPARHCPRAQGLDVTATDWVPGDPLMPDNGHGPMVTPVIPEDEQAAIRAEPGEVPPWFRPGNLPNMYASRCCRACGVRWSGDEPCWVCGQEGLG